jgi:membrane-associated phospholipid phosphatase
VFLIVLLLLFLAITIVVKLYSIEEFEAFFSKQLQARQNPILNWYMLFISFFGERPIAITMIAATTAGFLYFGYVREGFYIMLTAVASIINYFLKMIFNRPRPTDQLVEIIAGAENQSFPSGHTVHYVVFFGMLMIMSVRLKSMPAWLRLFIFLFSMVMILSVPFSRVYLGAHWTSDVMAGFIIGILILSVLLSFYFRSTNKVIMRE